MDVRAVRSFQISLGHVVVDDQRQPVRSNRYRRVLTNESCGVDVGRGCIGASQVIAVRYFQRSVKGVVVADDRSPIGADGEGVP